MDEVLRQVLGLYSEEFKEHSLVIAQSLILARRSSSVEERRALMASAIRRFHFIKGTTGTLGLFDLEDLAHAAETALYEFRSGDRSVGPGLARQLLYGLYEAQRFLAKAAIGGDPSSSLLRATVEELLRSAKE